jgi:hypothetical protein
MAGWTLDQLVARVAAVLDGHAGSVASPADRRVRQVPDRRAVRWYTTIGLLDRPEMRGRTGWYGERHLLQLVAIKRLQAAGGSLAEIQAELAGATDGTLRRIADLPDEPVRAPVVPSKSAERSARFWTGPADNVLARGTHPTVDTRWFAESGPVLDAGPAADVRPGLGGPALLRFALELADGVTLLVTPVAGRAHLDQATLSELRDAAGPLLDTLARHGLMSGGQPVPAALVAPTTPTAPESHDPEGETP